MDYESCRKRSRMIALATERRLMPPWPPVEGHGEFVGSRYLSAEEDCPIANAFAPEIQAIIDDHALSPFDFYLVLVDPEATPASVGDYAREHGYRGTLLIDAEHALAARVGVTRTPDVAVITRGGELSYRGRIDDRYLELGKPRPAPPRRDLRDHLRALQAGLPVAPARTEAVGCFLPDWP